MKPAGQDFDGRNATFGFREGKSDGLVEKRNLGRGSCNIFFKLMALSGTDVTMVEYTYKLQLL